MLFRRPLHEVAAWPDLHLTLLEHYLSRQPAPEERIEVAVATLCALFRNRHRSENEQAFEVEQFMPYRNPWAEAPADRYSEVDRSFFAAFGVRVK